MSILLAVASGKGGVGKTLITAALAVVLHRRGHTVLAVDADMGLRNLDLMFGMQDDVLFDIGDTVKGRCRIDEAVLSVAPGFDFLAASQKHTWEKIDAPTYHYVIETLAKKYDYTLIDCPAGRGKGYREASAIADRLFFVVEPTWSSLRDAARVMQYCNKHKRFNYDVIFNNFYNDVPGYVSVQEMMQVLNPECIAGILPHDRFVHQAAQDGTMIQADKSPFMKALEQTADYIESAVPVDSEYLMKLLPGQEGENFSGTVEPQEDGGTAPGYMKRLAEAELKKAASIFTESVQEMAVKEETMDMPAGSAQAGKTALSRLSLRNRRSQSAAWRHYRR